MESKFRIERHLGGTRITNITKDIICLDKTFNCGQSFRWKKVKEGTYTGVVYRKPLMIRQMRFGDGKEGLVTTLNIEDTKKIIVDYLQLNVDYDKEVSVDNLDEFARRAAQHGKGIRILNQEPWETLVSFIISQRNNIPKIIGTVDKLCNKIGDKVEYKCGELKVEGYSFPTPEQIAKGEIEKLQGIGLGYRDMYILEAAKRVVSGEFNLNTLKDSKVSGAEAVEVLEGLTGVGPKVANCVALFGLNKLEMFPIDIWIQRIIDEHYKNGIDIQNYGGLAGLIQQYMFYYIKDFK